MSKTKKTLSIRLSSSDRYPQYFYLRAEPDSEGTGVWLNINSLPPMHMSLEDYKYMINYLNSINGN